MAVSPPAFPGNGNGRLPDRTTRGILPTEVIDMHTSHEIHTSHDVVIVGGGAAGLSAALVLGRARRRVAVVDAGTPRNAPAAHMQGYLSRDGMPPAELLAVGRGEIAGYGVDVVTDTVTAVERNVVGVPDGVVEYRFTVHLASGATLAARQLLVTTGLIDDVPDLPGVRERWGRDVLHCPYCHGWEVRDRALGVLGTQPAAGVHAQLVRQWSDDVVFFVHTYELSATEREAMDARGIRLVFGEVAGLVVEDDRLTGVRLADGTVVARDAVFVRPGMHPRPGDLLAQLGCQLGAGGFAVVDATGRTTVRGVWAAGNAVDPRAQVITAAGQGSAAAIAVNGELTDQDVDRALGRSRRPERTGVAS